jgi:hypothetical protein
LLRSNAGLRNWCRAFTNGISFISFCFSRTDVAWMSNATAQTPSWISISKNTFNRKPPVSCIVYPNGFQMQYGLLWNNVGGRLSQYAEYKRFCAFSPVCEHCNVGSPAVSKSGRPKRSKPLVHPGQCIQHLNFMFDMPIAHCDVFHNFYADFLLLKPDHPSWSGDRSGAASPSTSCRSCWWAGRPQQCRALCYAACASDLAHIRVRDSCPHNRPARLNARPSARRCTSPARRCPPSCPHVRLPCSGRVCPRVCLRLELAGFENSIC